jgi:hypothetical protein
VIQPCKTTILRSGSMFTVLIEDTMNRVMCADELTYDEMLGTVARALVPFCSDGEPLRWFKPLFLSPPKHPDAAGDAAPPAAKPQPAPIKTPVSEGDDWL